MDESSERNDVGSSENETLFVPQSSENQNNNTSSGLLVAIDAQKAADTVHISGQMEQLPQSSEPLEPERAGKTGKCNMRKSLAWDSAFFTSAGVLEPDELSSMIKGVDKGGKHFLPGIEEDIRRSIDSISTIESESLTLESLEADLFQDIRASIQKSSKASNTKSSSKAAPGKAETQFIYSSEKVDLSSNNMMKPKPASKKQIIGMLGPGKLIKQSSGFSQATQPVARNGGSTASLPKARKVIGSPNPLSSVPLKRASFGANKAKPENDKARESAVPGKVDLVSKVSGLGGSSRAVPKPPLSSKSSLSSSAATKKLPPRSSSYDTSRSASSANGGHGISPVKSNKRRVDSKTVNPTSSSSVLKKPSKVPLKKKDQGDLRSSKLSSNSSPASSISEWSSESSSSTSTVHQRSNTSRVSLDTSSPSRSLDSDALPALDYHIQSNNQISIHGHKVNQPPSENLKKASVALSRPATAKPSGLRMPSPKMGFFDGAKHVDRSPNGSMQSYSGIPTSPKIGARISNGNGGGSSKAKNTKLQPARAVTATGNTKVDHKKPASPVPSKKPSNASPKVSNVSGGVKENLSISAQVQSKTDGESCLKAVEVGYEGTNEANGALKSGINLEKQDNTNKKDPEIYPIDGDTCALSSHCSAESLKLSEEVGEDAIFSLQQLKSTLHSLCKTDDKENSQFEDQVDGLSMHVGAMDSKEEMQKELVGNSRKLKSTLHSLCKSDEKENSQFEDQVDGLSMLVGAMDSKEEVQKELVGHSISEYDFSCPDSELSCSKALVSLIQKEGSLSNLSGAMPISDITASTKTPFAVKNSFNEENHSTRLSIKAVEKTSFHSLEKAQMENS